MVIQSDKRKRQLAATYVVSKEAKRFRDLRAECVGMLFDNTFDREAPSEQLLACLTEKGVKWDATLFDFTEPALDLLSDPTFSECNDPANLALCELADIRGVENDDSDEYYDLLEKLTEEAETAVYAARNTERAIHSLIKKCKVDAKNLYAMKYRALSAMKIPFVGFHRGASEKIMFAYFSEDGYGFHVPVRHVRRSESSALEEWCEDECCYYYEGPTETSEWEMTGIPTVDEALKNLNTNHSQPEYLSDEAIGLIAARVDADKSLGLSFEEAVGILRELLEQSNS